MVHSILGSPFNYIDEHRWLFHVSKVPEKISQRGWEIRYGLGRILFGTNKALMVKAAKGITGRFSDVARHKIAGKIGELALKDKAGDITEDLVIRGYIIATPKRDHKFVQKKLAERKVNMVPYEHLFS